MMQGLSISLVGLLITFFALMVFILLMIVLQRIFPAERKEIQGDTGSPEVRRLNIDEENRQKEDKLAIAAAIAVAIEYIHKGKGAALGSNLVKGHGQWWVANPDINSRDSQLKKG
jgi:hypothetical protein